MKIRWLVAILWLPLALVGGGFASEWLAASVGVWSEYVGAIVLPSVGLLGIYWIAPHHKAAGCAVFYVIGMALAFTFFFPSSYPESHPKAYEPTYAPFLLTLSVATTLLGLLGTSLRRRRDPDAH